MRGTNIKPDVGLPLEPLVSLWSHRELFRRILLRDLQSAFRGSVLGLGWIIVIPLILVTIYTFVFGIVLNAAWPIEPRSRFEVPLIYFAGVVVFSFLMEIVTRSPNYIRDNRTYVTKIIFPVDILCWVLAGTSLVKFTINMVLLVAFIAVATGSVPPGVLLLPLLMAPFVLMAVGISWMLAAIGAFIRDLSHALQAIVPIVMFVSPVFYPVERVPEPFQAAYYLNPLTFMLESVRGLLFFGTPVSLGGYLAFWLASIAVFTLGYALFRRLRPGFADVV